MSVGEFCNRNVVIVERAESALEAARLMREYHVGDVVVVEETAEGKKPVGILTDRDIVIELVAEGVDLEAISVGDAMSNQLLIVAEGDELADATAKMRARGVRRAPVVDKAGVLVGILTVDDILEVLAGELADLVRLTVREQHHEREVRSEP
jgi:predicted transcriptional regulator